VNHRSSIVAVSSVLIVALYLGLAAKAQAATCTRKLVATPGIASRDAQLRGIAAHAAGDIWAVGAFTPATGVRSTLIEHYDGTAWSVVPSTDPGSEGDSLYGVVSRSASDVWAVGVQTDSSFNETALIEHDAGSGWVSVPAAPLIATGSELTKVTGVPGSAALWSVGDYVPSGQSSSQPLIERWDGANWTVTPTPVFPGGADLTDVTAIGATSARAAGDRWNTQISGLQTLVLHWNGSAWKAVPSRNYLTDETRVSAIDRVPGSKSVWMAGQHSANTGAARTLTERYTSSTGKWKLISSPNLTTGHNVLTGLAPITGSQVFASGYAYTDSNGSPIHTLLELWNGTTWKLVTSPSPPNADGVLADAVRVPGTSQVWSAGYRTNLTTTTTAPLVERVC
jgi:hypothetical protein